MGACRGAHLFALRVWARTAQTSARTAETCGPDRPDMWPGHVARTARTCGRQPDMWPGQPGLWPGCQPIMASARVAMFRLAGEGRLAGQPGQVARTARTGGPDSPDSSDMWPGQPGLWPGCQPIMASARVAMFRLAGEGRLAGQPGQVARTARTGGPDSPDGSDMWPGQPGHAPRTARTPDGPDMWPARPGRSTNHG